MTKIVLVDDHVLLRNGLVSLINSFPDYTILFEANNGKQFVKQLDPENLPEIVILDITMPEMNGYETALWLTNHYPQIKILALTMLSDERSIIRMFKNGAKGFLLKDCRPQELKAALDGLMHKGVYLNRITCDSIIHNFQSTNSADDEEQKMVNELDEKEKEFLALYCTEKTHREIAEVMGVPLRVIDNFRDLLYQKLQVSSRVGLALIAMRNNIGDSVY
jgi:DNA-binding NarL/FixJ family response regulator